MPSWDPGILELLQTMMHECNPYVNAFVTVGQVFKRNPHVELKMMICESRSTSRQYLVPMASEVATIMPRQGDDFDVGNQDVQILSRSGVIRRISNLHRAYMPLMYVLLFP